MCQKSNTPTMLLDDIPASLLVIDACNNISGTNKHFRQHIMNVHYLTKLNFVQDLVECPSMATVATALDETRNTTVSHDVTCCLLFLTDNITDFPLYQLFHLSMQQSKGLDEVIVSVNKVHPASEYPRAPDLDDLINNAPIALHRISPSGIVLWANKTELQLLGYTAEEFIGQHLSTFCNDDADEVKRVFELLASGATLKNKYSEWVTKTGEKRHVRIDSNANIDYQDRFLHTRCFIQDDTARQIKEARVHAEMANTIDKARAQDGFLRRVLHEIRTPLHVITQTMAHTEPCDEFDVLKSQVSKLLNIVKDVEDVDTFELGKTLAVHPTRFHILELLQKLMDQCGLEYSHRDVQRSLHCRTEFVPEYIMADRTCIVRVVSHLLDNALRFTQEGFVKISVGIENEVCDIAIENSGSSISQDVLYEYFDKYRHKHPAAESTLFGGGEGIGLGLRLASHILQSMGSSLELKSKDGVNTFSFKLKVPILEKVKACEYAPRAKRRMSGIRELSPPRWVPMHECALSKTYITESRELAPLSPLRSQKSNTCDMGQQLPTRYHILVVEDNCICQRVLCRTLKMLDCSTEVAENGKIACKMTKPEAFDLIFMDNRMPVMDGIQASVEMRKKGITTPIVGFSADSTHEIQVECERAGMNGFLCKPASQKQIRDTLLKYLG